MLVTSYKIKYKKPAEKFILKNKLEGIRFIKAFDEISHNLSNVKKYDIKKYYCSEENFYRLRIGKYRAIFQINGQEIIIIVFDIDSRGDIYK